jgi:hypothetical protein
MISDRSQTLRLRWLAARNDRTCNELSDFAGARYISPGTEHADCYFSAASSPKSRDKPTAVPAPHRALPFSHHR